jgi:AcrR family transcriptional regulator
VSKGTATREAILQRGLEAASRVGLSGMTIGDLASATGMSKSGLYAHARSKESLQLQVLQQAREEFIDAVIRPTVATPRGEPRVRALFEYWLTCIRDNMPGGCLLFKAAIEYDDRPGAVRDQVVRDHNDLRETITQVFSTGTTERHFRADADPAQFAADLHGVMLNYAHSYRLLDDPAAETQARRAFDALLNSARR